MSEAEFTFGPSNLKTLRTESRLSRREFIDRLKDATGLELHQTSLQRIESGDQTMKASDAVAFANFFGVSLESFLLSPLDSGVTHIAGLTRELDSAATDAATAALALGKAMSELAEWTTAPDAPPKDSEVMARAALSMEVIEPLVDKIEGARDEFMQATQIDVAPWSGGDDGER